MVLKISMKMTLGSTFLQGRPLGRKHYPMLCAKIGELTDGGIVLLDFAGIEIITGSWINESIVPLMTWMADGRNDLFPVLMNMQPEWIDDLHLIAQFTHCCFLVGDGSELPQSAQLAGSLDLGQRETLAAVVVAEGVTGAALERLKPEAGVKATAWNNRLKDLFQKRLLRREKRGREQLYWPVVPEVTFHG